MSERELPHDYRRRIVLAKEARDTAVGVPKVYVGSANDLEGAGGSRSF